MSLTPFRRKELAAFVQDLAQCDLSAVSATPADVPRLREDLGRQLLFHEVLIAGLELIRGDHCESFTTGLGSCFRNGRTPDAIYGADRCCLPCIADSTLRCIPLPTKGRS